MEANEIQNIINALGAVQKRLDARALSADELTALRAAAAPAFNATGWARDRAALVAANRLRANNEVLNAAAYLESVVGALTEAVGDLAMAEAHEARIARDARLAAVQA